MIKETGKHGPDIWNRKDEIIELYKNLSSIKIAKIFNCSSTAVCRILRKNNIEIKDAKFFNKGKHNSPKTEFKKGQKHPKEWYENKKGWSKGLTKETDERVKKQAEKMKERKFTKKHRENISLAKEIKLNMDLIKKEYIENEKSCKEIGKMFGTNHSTIWNRLKKEGVKLRENHVFIKRTRIKQSVAKQGIPLEKWEKFVSREPYGQNWTNKLREEIRKRDNYACQECGILQEELKQNEKSNYNKKLRVHHIDYNKQNNSIFNLISLCLKCHIKTNSNRKHWTNYFKMKIFIKEFFNPQNIKVFNENRQLIAMEKIRGVGR